MITYKIISIQSSTVQSAVILMKGINKVLLEESMAISKGQNCREGKGLSMNTGLEKKNMVRFSTQVTKGD